MGTRFIATKEGVASEEYKQGLVSSQASDIIYTNLFTGVHGNYLRSSIVNAGLDPDNLPVADKNAMNFSSGSAKAWRDIWGAGQSVAGIESVKPAAEVVDQLVQEYEAARARLAL
jgi:nitronate monooxygenase